MFAQILCYFKAEISFSKSYILFSGNVGAKFKNEISDRLQMKVVIIGINIWEFQLFRDEF